MSSAIAAVGRGLKRLVQIALALVVLVALYYAVGSHLVHRIDADPAFAEDIAVPEGGSTLVATMAALIRREVDQHGWVANDPVIFPSALLDDMAAYQQALVNAIRGVLDTLDADAPGDAGARASAALADARAALAVPPDRWTFDLARGVRPQTATETAYRDAADALTRFNAALAAGTATLASDPARVRDQVAALAATVDAAAVANLAHVDARGGHWLDTTADDRFQETRAVVYARLLFLRALAADHGELFADRDDALEAALARLARAAELAPWYVVNGPADGQWRPSHLAAQAAYAREAATAVRALAEDLAAGDT
ncbi:MAG: hypothetical protein ACLFTG_07945 [Alphaproteobacteria bacterium]